MPTTCIGIAGAAIIAQTSVPKAGELVLGSSLLAMMQSAENDLATMRSGSYATTATRTVGAAGSDTFATGTSITVAIGANASLQGRTQFRPRVVCPDATQTIDVQHDTYVLPNAPAAQRLITISTVSVVPRIGERVRIVVPGLQNVTGNEYQITRTGVPAGLLASIWSSAVITYLPIAIEFEYGAGLLLVVTGTASGTSSRVRLTLAFPTGWGALGNPTDSLATGDQVVVAGVGGTTEANGTWTITVNDGTHITLTGTTWANAWTSGGTATITPGVWRLGMTSGTSYDGLARVGVLPDGAS